MNNILILGTGFLGYNLCIGFHESNYNYYTLDKVKINLKKQIVYDGFKSIDQAFSKCKPDVIYYLIDNHDSNIPNSVNNDIYFFTRILNLCVKYNVKKVVLTTWLEMSTDSCTNCNNTNKFSYWIKEVKHINYYSMELYLQYYKDRYNIDFVSLRMPKVYGYKKYNHWSNNIVDDLIRSTNIELVNETLNLIYIGDAVSALIFALKKEVSGIYTIIGDIVYTDEITNYIKHLYKKKLKLKIMNNNEDNSNIVTVNSLANFGWNKLVSLQSGINTTFIQITNNHDNIGR